MKELFTYRHDRDALEFPLKHIFIHRATPADTCPTTRSTGIEEEVTKKRRINKEETKNKRRRNEEGMKMKRRRIEDEVKRNEIERKTKRRRNEEETVSDHLN